MLLLYPWWPVNRIKTVLKVMENVILKTYVDVPGTSVGGYEAAWDHWTKVYRDLHIQITLISLNTSIKKSTYVDDAPCRPIGSALFISALSIPAVTISMSVEHCIGNVNRPFV